MNTPTIHTPDAVVRYFDACNRFDAPSAAACFTSDAVVHDEGHHHIGTEAITRWVSQTSESYQPNSTVLSTHEKGNIIAVKARVSGKFPGSPLELEFEFTLRDQKISELKIQ